MGFYVRELYRVLFLFIFRPNKNWKLQPESQDDFGRSSSVVEGFGPNINKKEPIVYTNYNSI